MRKLLLLAGAAFMLSANSFGQSPVGKGSIIVDPYIGLPNWGNSMLYSSFDATLTGFSESEISNYKTVGGFMSYGGRFEYMVGDKIGVGLDGNYEVSGFRFDFESGSETYEYKYTAKKMRFMARFNYHFIQNDKFNMYLGLGIGYRNVVRTEETTQPGIEPMVYPGIVPVATRAGLGFRYYFIENLGVNAELGLGGGGIFQVGLSGKF